MAKRVAYVLCELCGKTDASDRKLHHVGTQATLRCDHCGGFEELANLTTAGVAAKRALGTRTVPAPARRCRDCCPTGHHTRYNAAIAPGEMSLTETLAKLGFTHRHCGPMYQHEILDGARVVFVGAAHSTWDWLRETSRILPTTLTRVPDRDDFDAKRAQVANTIDGILGSWRRS